MFKKFALNLEKLCQNFCPKQKKYFLKVGKTLLMAQEKAERTKT
jgi:hypothetical protein